MANKTALITGASSGIGEAFARQLAAQGYNLCITARRTDRLESIASELRGGHGARVEALTADLAEEAGIRRVEAWIESNAPLEMLVNNAGFGVRGLFSRMSPGRHLKMMAVHMTASVRLMAAVLPGMKKAGRGFIVNVSSPAAYFPMAGNGAYSGTKSFLNVFSEALACELDGTGVKVQVLLPGFTYSDFHKQPDYIEMDLYNTLPRFLWMSSEQVVQTSLAALERGRLFCTPGWINRLGVVIGKLRLYKLLGFSPNRLIEKRL